MSQSYQTDYIEINLSLLAGSGNYLVDCESEEEARHFISEMKRQYPEKSEYWDVDDTKWNKDGMKVLYLPNINRDDRMYWDNVVNFDDSDYEIIQFSSLLPETDIDESDMLIDILLS